MASATASPASRPSPSARPPQVAPTDPYYVSLLAQAPLTSENSTKRLTDTRTFTALGQQRAGMASLSDGRILVSDYQGAQILVFTPEGKSEVFAGTGQPGDQDGPRLQSSWRTPNALLAGPDGTVYVSETQRIRSISPDGTVKLLAGASQLPDKLETENARISPVDGQGSEARFVEIRDLTWGPDNALYLVEQSATAGWLRRVSTSGEVKTLMVFGNHVAPPAAGDSAYAELYSISFTPNGKLFVLNRAPSQGTVLEVDLKTLSAQTLIPHCAGIARLICDFGGGSQALLLRSDAKGRLLALDDLGHLYQQDLKLKNQWQLLDRGTDGLIRTGAVEKVQLGQIDAVSLSPEGDFLLLQGLYNVFRLTQNHVPVIAEVIYPDNQIHFKTNTEVQVKGAHFDQIKALYLGTKPLPFSLKDSKTLHFHFPAQPLTGQLRVESYAGQHSLWYPHLTSIADQPLATGKLPRLLVQTADQTFLFAGTGTPQAGERLFDPQQPDYRLFPQAAGFEESAPGNQTSCTLQFSATSQPQNLLALQVQVELKNPDDLEALKRDYQAEAEHAWEQTYYFRTQAAQPLEQLAKLIAFNNGRQAEDNQIQQVVFADLDAARTLTLLLRLLKDPRIQAVRFSSPPLGQISLG